MLHHLPCRPRRRTGPCTPAALARVGSLQAIVDAYIRDHRDDAEREMQFYRDHGSLQSAIEYAALSKLPDGRRHPHQRRLRAEVLAEAERRLQSAVAALRRCRSFDELHRAIEREIGTVAGIGRLAVYDIATRVGAHLKVEPEAVYLHAGTAKGAKALGLDHRQRSLEIAELPEALRQLRPREIEDCLCLYDEQLRMVRA
jgi:hypothetical protein